MWQESAWWCPQEWETLDSTWARRPTAAAPVSTWSEVGVGYHMEGSYFASGAFRASPCLIFMTILQGRTQSPHRTVRGVTERQAVIRSNTLINPMCVKRLPWPQNMAALIQWHSRKGIWAVNYSLLLSRLKKYYNIKNVLCKEPYPFLLWNLKTLSYPSTSPIYGQIASHPTSTYHQHHVWHFFHLTGEETGPDRLSKMPKATQKVSNRVRN